MYVVFYHIITKISKTRYCVQNIPDRVDFPQSLVNASPAPSNGNEMRNTKKRHRWTFDEEEA